MDGVLCDFVGGALEYHGLAPALQDDMPWDIAQYVGFTLQEFWLPLGGDFWRDLCWTWFGRALFGSIQHEFADFGILTSLPPCNQEEAMQGKKMWLREHGIRCEIAFASNKRLVMMPGDVLIDDADHNMPDVLVPQPWNANRGKPINVDDLIRRLKEADVSD